MTMKKILAVGFAAIAAAGSALAAAEPLMIPFEMPYDGKATVVIDDASGRRVRNLVCGIAYPKGRHEVEWDGRAEDGTGAEPGACRIRVFTHRGLSYDFKGSFAAGGEKRVSPFGPTHLPCSMSMARGDRVVVASLFTEGGNSTIVLDLEGHFVRGWGEGWHLGNKACAYLTGGDRCFYSVREKDGNELQFLGYTWNDSRRPNVKIVSSEKTELKGAVQVGGKVYVANGLTKTIDVYEIRETFTEKDFKAELVFTGEKRPVGFAGPLCAVGDEIVPAFKPEQLSVTADAKLVYAIEQDSSVIHVYDRATKKEVRTIGEDGGGYAGPWKKDRLVRPTSCALDSAGFLWVTENRYSPKRISKWDVQKGTCVYEKFGTERYGTPGGGMDCADATRWMAHDTEWRYDPAKGIDYPIACSFDETLKQGERCDVPPRSARTYSWVHRGGKTYLVGTDANLTIWEYVDAEKRLKPVMLLGSSGIYAHKINRKNSCEPMREAYEKAFPEIVAKKKEGAFKGDEETLMVWRDLNGNERFDADEFSFAPYGTGAPGGWGLSSESIDFTCCLSIDGEYNILEFTSPEWSMEKALANRRKAKGRIPPGVRPIRRVTQTCTPDGYHVLTAMEPYMLGFDRTGSLAWYLKNPDVDVHGSHKAGLPRPGELQGVLFTIGSVPCGTKGERRAMAVKNNHGRIFFITTDGIYLDELFSDCRVSAANDETYIGGESFGGSFAWDEKGKRAVLASGGSGYRWYEIKGLDTLEERATTRTFTARELIEAQERNPLVDPRRAVAPVTEVRPSERKGKLERIAEWKAGDRPVRLDAATEDGFLRLRYDVPDASPWVNNGSDRHEMFKTGDCVDFQFLRGKDPVRVMAYPAGEGAEVVVYDFRASLAKLRGETPAPRTFASPWRTFASDHVFFPADVKPTVKRRADGYVLELPIPLAWFADGQRTSNALTCDFGVIFGDRDGTINMSRVYWANKDTGLVNDVPGEIMPEPKKWGRLKGVGNQDGKFRRTPTPSTCTFKLKPAGALANPHGIVSAAASDVAYGKFGVGPVYDGKRKLIYASTGNGRISALTEDGRQEAVYTLPGAQPFGRFDMMAIDTDGAVYVLAGGNAAADARHPRKNAGNVYRIRPGGQPERIATGICAIATHVRDGKLACLRPDATVSLMDLATGALAPFGEATPERDDVGYACMLDWTPQGELMTVLRHTRAYVYRNGKPERTPPLFGSRDIGMSRGTVIGDELWVLAGGTIKRFDARTLKAAPGVVYGGASGFFLGHVTMNTEMNASGICKVGGGLYAVHTVHNSAVYLMRYDAGRQELQEVRRLGGIREPADLLVDEEGMVLCDGLVWPFDAEASAPPQSTQRRDPVRACATLPNGETLRATLRYGEKIEFRRGRLAAGELSLKGDDSIKPIPMVERGMDKRKLEDERPVATVVQELPVKGGSARIGLAAIFQDGKVKRYVLRHDGTPERGDAWFCESQIEGDELVDGVFADAARLSDGTLLASVGGQLARYSESGDGWAFDSVSGKVSVDALATDGDLVVLANAKAGTLTLMRYENGKYRRLDEVKGLAAPAKVALRAGRLVVWERAAQRLVRFTLEEGDPGLD